MSITIEDLEDNQKYNDIKYSPIRFYYSHNRRDYVKSKTRYNIFDYSKYNEFCDLRPNRCPLHTKHVKRCKKNKLIEHYIKWELLQ